MTNGLPDELLLGRNVNVPPWAKYLDLPIQQVTTLPTVISLGALKAGTRLLPCLSGDADLAYQMSLQAPSHPNCALAPIALPKTPQPATKPDPQKKKKNQNQPPPWARSHLDWFEINEDVEQVSLSIKTQHPAQLKEAWLHCSFRQAAHPPLAAHAGDHLSQNRPPLPVPPYSQMSLPDAIRKRVCAPVCLAMLMAYQGQNVDLEAFTALNRHPASGLYGVWPQNILTLNHHGISASVRYFKSIRELIQLLDQGVPVPVSIAFAKGALAGAPLSKTAGHVLVVTGIQDGRVHVNDPAAATPEQVPRTYDLSAFCKAWLNHHGIGYIISPQRAKAL